MDRLLRYKFTFIYVLSIVFVNVSWAWYGEYLLWKTPWEGVTWAPLSMVVGLWFVFRDYAQIELGNKVLLAMLAGMAATYLLGGPGIAIASCTAFAVGETIDWIVFSRVKQNFAKRMIISSLIAAPVDTVIFLFLADYMNTVNGKAMLSWPTTLTEVASKLAAAYIVYLRIKGRNRQVISGHAVA